MKTVELKIDDEFYDELVQMLPRKRASIVNDSFLEHQKLLQKELENYKQSELAYTLYSASIEETNSWIEEQK